MRINPTIERRAQPVAAASKAAFKACVQAWADKLDVNVARLAIRPMRNKWASCSTKGHLNVNLELLDLDASLWDYVIVHELLHLCVPNHGKLWQSLMHAHLGDYERLEQELAAQTRRKSD